MRLPLIPPAERAQEAIEVRNDQAFPYGIKIILLAILQVKIVAPAISRAGMGLV